MLPVISALLSALAPTLVNTVADKLLGADHPLADTAKKAVLEVAQEVIGDKINDRTQAEEAGVQIGTNPELKLEFQRLLNARLANDAVAETERLRLVLADTQSAREREVALAKLGMHDWRADALVATAIAAVLACVYALTLDAVQVARDFVISVGTLFAAKVGTAFDYHFGSSADRARR
jgi:anti-sigma-K factor RskA